MNKIMSYLGRKFMNFVFRRRLGKSVFSAKVIFRIMDFFGQFETYVNTGESGIFDHYVPQLLLNRWRISEEGSDKGQVWCWLKREKKIDKKPIKQIVGAIDWDGGKVKGAPSDFVRKKMFSNLLEPYSSKVIKLINEDSGTRLTFPEFNTLAVFVGYQMARVPSFHAAVRRYLAAAIMHRAIPSKDFTSKVGDRDWLLENIIPNKLGICYEECIDQPQVFDAEKISSLIQSLTLFLGSTMGEDIARSKNLHVLEIPKDDTDEFVISDNPVVILDLGPRQDLLQFMPWWEITNGKFMVFLPISPKKAIWYCDSMRRDGPVESENHELVRLANFGQYKYSSEVVLSRDRQILENHLRFYTSGKLDTKLKV